MYITYEEYVALGGKISQDTFPLAEKLAEKKLDSYTPNAVHPLTPDDDIRLAMTVIINRTNEIESAGSIYHGKVASVSNDGYSVSFGGGGVIVGTAVDELSRNLYNEVAEIIPKLVKLGVC